MSTLSDEINRYLPKGVELIVLGYVGKWEQLLTQFTSRLLVGKMVYERVYNILNRLEPRDSPCECQATASKIQEYRSGKTDNIVYVCRSSTLIMCRHMWCQTYQLGILSRKYVWNRMIPRDLPDFVVLQRLNLLAMNDPYLSKKPIMNNLWADGLALWFFHHSRQSLKMPDHGIKYVLNFHN